MKELETPKTTLTLLYISNLSEVIRQVLAPLDIQVVSHPLRWCLALWGGVSPSDDPLPTAGPPQGLITNGGKKGSGLLYFLHSMPKVYIGQTGRSLKHRLKEHWRALRNGNVAAFASAKHALMAGHGIDLSKTNPIHRFAWEHIQHNENKLNRERGNLPQVYAALLDWNVTLRHYICAPSHYTDTLHILATCIVMHIVV